jgi:glycosyltransferase involved in cell wall biosynthesis
VCNSDPVRRAIASYGIRPERIHVIPAFSRQYLEGPRADAPPPPIVEFMSRHAPVLVCYTAFRPEFMLDQFLRVLAGAIRSRCRLGVVVIGHLRGHEPFLARARELGLEHALHLAGDLAHDDFLATVRRADLFVRTHLRDGVSSSVLEALALGTPVLAAANESRPEGVVTYDGTDAGDFARTLDLVLGDARRRAVAPSGVALADTLRQEAALLLDPGRNGGSYE